MAVDVGHDFGKRINCHARAAKSVKRAVKCGVDVIYHCESADEEALDMLESVKHKIFVGPAIGIIYGTIHDGLPWFTKEFALEIGMQRVIDDSRKVYTELRKRGVKAVIGGDYGFAQSPQGTNAKDLKHFVDLLGYSPSEAMVCATRYGGEIMGMGDELGQVKEGFIADLLLVDGDPLKELERMPDEDYLLVIMKDGALYKDNSKAAKAGKKAAE
jgi:imidazolonepropionase-like amidohydrolase